MGGVALLSNPRSTGNRDTLPKVRSFVAENPDIFHYEVGDIDEVPEALRMIARIKPTILVINGGDGTVQATLTELHHGQHFAGEIPPVAVLPNGKTNLIALDLGADGDAMMALKAIVKIAGGDVSRHVVARQLIALSDGKVNRPVLGMFLGGAGLAEAILFCRHKIYPLGLPNWISHVMATAISCFGVVTGSSGAWNPMRPRPMRVTLHRGGAVEGSFALLMVTTLERLLLNFAPFREKGGSLKMMAVEQRRSTVVRVVVSAIFGRLGSSTFKGLHLRRGDEIRIEGQEASVILDGETYQAPEGEPIVLTPTPPVSFLSLSA